MQDTFQKEETPEQLPSECLIGFKYIYYSWSRDGVSPKVFIDSDTDQDFPPHIPILQDYCRTCLTEKVKCFCQPTSNWSGELIDITQVAPPNTDTNQDREDIQDNPLPSDWTDQDDFWLGKTYDKAKALSTLKPAPPNPPSKGDEDSE